MVQILQAEKITLYELIQNFNLQLNEDPQFFRECWENLPEINEYEKPQLNRIKSNYLNLAVRPVLEDLVKMVVLSPLLDLAGFYSSPFYTTSETSVEIEAADGELIIRGKIDILVWQENFWILVIESKRSAFSLEVGIPQALAYMLANKSENQPLFGMVTNGSNFIFLKLLKDEMFNYALSDELTLRRGNDLFTVLAILKNFREKITT